MSALRQQAARSFGPEQNIARPIAVLLGAIYLGAGIIGFVVTGFSGFVSSGGAVLLFFHLNIFHNLVHIAIGALLLVASRIPDVNITHGILFGVGILYVAAVLLGALNALPIIAVHGIGDPDNELHLVSALTALGGGFLGARQHDRAVASGLI
ncbi:MAG: DUF4383 domain-containing protein [Solirubrobacterales bacterium]|nr:MAG: DUF4383 domain-containing protein [Solirubrobacterales bacterium]